MRHAAVSAPTPPALGELGYPSRSLGESAYSENALVYSLLRMRSETALVSPVKVLMNEREVPPTNAVARLLAEPTRGQSWAELLELIWLSHDLAGNVYLLKVRPDGVGPVMAYYLLRPDCVTIEAPNGEIVYRYQPVNGKARTYAAEDVAHFRSQTIYNEFYGQSPLAAARVAIAADTNMTRMLSRFISKAGVSTGFIHPVERGDPYTDTEQDTIIAAWNEMVARGGVAFLDGPLAFEPASKLESPEMVDARRQLQLTICQALDVPAAVANIEAEAAVKAGRNELAEKRRFWENTVRVMLLRLEAFLTRMVRADWGDAYRIEFDLSRVDVLNDSLEARSRVAERMVKAGIWTPDEGRQETGKESMGGEAALLRPPGAAPAPAGIGFSRDAQAPDARYQSAAELKRVFESVTDEDVRKFARNARRAMGTITRDADDLLKRGVFSASDLIPPSADDVVIKAFRPGYEASARRTWSGVNGWGGLGDVSVDDDALHAMSSRAEQRWRGINANTRAAVKKIVDEGREAGMATDEIRQRVQGTMRSAYDGRVEAIARTEMTYARNDATVTRYEASGVTEVLVSDGDEDAACAAVAGTRQTVVWARANPLAHPNCTRSFTPIRDTLLRRHA